MSIDQGGTPVDTLRQVGAGRVRGRAFDRYPPMLQAQEATRIAHTLTEKYGRDALPLARDRAARAAEVGDDLALDAWRSVIEATKALLRGPEIR